MKSLRFAVLALSVLGLSACATMDEESTGHAPPPRAPSLMDTDEAYVAQVERIARRRGIEVQWVNLPRKQVVATHDGR